MANYNLVTFLLLLLLLLATVLMTSLVDSYSRFDVLDVLSLRIFNTERTGQEEVNQEKVMGVETELMRPEGWVGYPVVSINNAGDSGFAPGVR